MRRCLLRFNMTYRTHKKGRTFRTAPTTKLSRGLDLPIKVLDLILDAWYHSA
jgi:hypothetical protein